MKTFNFNKGVIALFSIIAGLFACEKYKEDIFTEDFQKVYGEWISNKKCGGISGDCYDYKGEILKIIEYGKFEIINNQENYVSGYIKIISQDEYGLVVRFEEKRGKLKLFSSDDLLVTFNGNDTIIFAEGCCDRFSYEFIRME